MYRAGDAKGLYAGFLVEEQQNKVFKKSFFQQVTSSQYSIFGKCAAASYELMIHSFVID